MKAKTTETVRRNGAGQITCVERYAIGWFKIGRLLQDAADGQPAVQCFNDTGQLIYTARFTNGRRHDGAVVRPVPTTVSPLTPARAAADPR